MWYQFLNKIIPVFTSSVNSDNRLEVEARSRFDLSTVELIYSTTYGLISDSLADDSITTLDIYLIVSETLRCDTVDFSTGEFSM